MPRFYVACVDFDVTYPHSYDLITNGIESYCWYDFDNYGIGVLSEFRRFLLSCSMPLISVRGLIVLRSLEETCKIIHMTTLQGY